MDLAKYHEFRQRPAGMLTQAAVRGFGSISLLEFAPSTMPYEVAGVGLGVSALFKLGEAAIEKFSFQEVSRASE